MTTSGVTALNLTARDIIGFALRKLSTMPIGSELDINEVAPVLLELNMMLKGWQTAGPHLWRNTEGTQALSSATASYSLATANPLRIVEARYRNTVGSDLPMKRLSRVRYMQLPLKSSAGTPTQFYFDPQETSQTLYVWPVLGVATTQSIVYTYQRRFQVCASLDDSVDIPEEWLDTVGYCLAERLIPNYGIETQSAARIERNAQVMLRRAKAFDRPAYINFMPEYAPHR
jgi:hypothetical protein